MEGKQESAPADSRLIDDSVIEAAAELQTQSTGEEVGVFATEPHLARFVNDRLHVIVGKLALAGAGEEIVQGVFADVRGLAAMTATIVRVGDRQLFEGLLPYPDGRIRFPEEDQHDEQD